MPANVESMFFKGATPWHGLGVEIPKTKRLSAHEALVAAGCDWEVGKLPLVISPAAKVVQGEDGDKETFDIPQAMRGQAVTAYCTYRKTDNAILGQHVGRLYTPYQNEDAFGWYQPFLDKNELEFHTAGSLNDGRTVWCLAKLNRKPIVVVKGDEIEKYLLLSNAHDGTKAAKIGFTPIRVVCVNTLSMAHGSIKSKLLSVRHSPKILENMDMIRETVNLWNEAFEATAEQYRFLAKRGVNSKTLEKYVKIVLSKKEEVNEEEETSTKMENMLLKVFGAFEDPRGGALAPGTWWAAYNAITEYLSYDSPTHSDSNRLSSLWYGPGLKMNQNALDIAIKMAS
jgi:phage/plasmid-like protein (TIGR03299 family)